MITDKKLPAGINYPLPRLSDYKHALDKAAIVAITDRVGKITYVNESFCKISKYPENELLGKDHRIINSGHHSKEFMRNLWVTIQKGKIWKGEIKNRAKDGSLYWVDTTIVPFLNEKGAPYQHVAIRYDITEKKEQEEELRKSKETLEYINRNLKQFAYTVSHDLKSPLNGMLGMMEVMAYKQKELQDPELEKYLEIVKNNASFMKELINGVLEYSKVEQMEKKIEELNPSVEIDNIMQIHKGPQVRLKRTGAVDSVYYNKTCFQQVISNLISNGIKYCDKDKVEIQISIKEDGDNLQFAVSDNGPGVPYDKQDYIFEMFSSLKLERNASNTGIGLATTKRIVEAFGGTIGVNSVIGEGSSFYFTIPKLPESI